MAGCPEPRVEGALFGRDCGHLNDWYAGRIVRMSDGSFAVPGPQARPRWLARQERPEAEGNTMNRLERDETGRWAA